MALKGIRVIEMAGLAPAPFCGLILADFGANVIKVNRSPIDPGIHTQDTLTRGKRSIAVNMKKPEGVDLIRRLCKKADVLIEPFRKGVMEKNGLGPDVLLADNPGLIYARITGYGQDGPLSTRAGHDINYLAISGVLSMLGGKSDKPQPPINLLADFAGGGLMGALGIALALFERSKSGKGQVIDANMVEGAAYIGSFLGHARQTLWGQRRGGNMLDGGMAFYDTYTTKDGKFVSVGAIEPQFFNKLVIGLGLKPDDVSQFSDQDVLKQQFSDIFASKTRDEWDVIFNDVDACVEPILEWDEAPNHPHNKERAYFLRNPSGYLEPGPAPRLSRTPATNESLPRPSIGQQTTEVLQEIGYSPSEIQQLLSKDVVEQTTLDSKL